ncbi:MAG: hypothetical protein LBN34_08320 [Clostridiales Family XIII bacterium]|jgi:hypothetical protein|nr:hypothetical protein [Clostridiales Family XIII bacterium]
MSNDVCRDDLGEFGYSVRGKAQRKLAFFLIYILVAVFIAFVFFLPSSFMKSVFKTDNQLLIVIMGLVIVAFLCVAAVNSFREFKSACVNVYDKGFVICSALYDTPILYKDVFAIECFDTSPFKKYIQVYNSYTLEFFDREDKGLGQLESATFRFPTKDYWLSLDPNEAEVKEKIAFILK